MASSGDNGQKVSKWGQRRRYLPSARFSTERLDLILAKLKGPEQDENMPGSKHKSQQDLSVDTEQSEDRTNSKSWNVYMHDSPFAKNRSIFEDLIAEKSEKTDDTKTSGRTKPKRLPTYDEFIQNSPEEAENSNTYDLTTIKDPVAKTSLNQSQLKKFEHDIDTVPTRDTEPPMDTVNDAKSDTASITSSGNDVVSRDGHHNDSGYHDDVNNDMNDSRKGVSFSIETGRRTWQKTMDNDNTKSATLPNRGSCRGREGFVTQAKSWWQSKQDKSSTEQFQPPPLSPPPNQAKDPNNNTNRLYQKRQSASTLHKQKQGISTTARSSTPQFKDRFSSAKVKTEEEKRAERKHKDNSNAPPLSMQSTEAFRIWKLREELDNRTREAEAFAEEVEKQLPNPKSRPTTPTAGRGRPHTPTSIRPTTPSDLRPMSPAVGSRSQSEGRRLPSIPADRALSPTPSEKSYRNRPTTPSSDRSRNRPTTPSNDKSRNRPTTPSSDRSRNRPTTPSNDRSRNRPTTPNLDRLMQPTKASKARSSTPSREYKPLNERNTMRSTTPTSSTHSSTQSPDRSRRPTTPSRDYARSPDRASRPNHRPTTPSRDRALSPSPQRSRTSSTDKALHGRYEQNDARSNTLAPVTNRARGRRVQPQPPDTTSSRSRSRTPSRDRAKSPSALRDGAVSPALLERAISPSPVGISIRERQLIQAKMTADTPGAPQPSRSKSADILGEKSDWPVAPPRRTRKRPGRILPTPPEQPTDARPKSPFCARPVTPSMDTGIPGEGEALDEPNKDSSMDTSVDSNVFSSPEQEDPPALKSPQNQISSLLINKTIQESRKLDTSYPVKQQKVESSSPQKPTDSSKQTKTKPETKPRSIAKSETVAHTKDSISQRKNAPTINLPEKTPATKTEITSPGEYKRSPSDSKLRAQTPTRSILKKTPRAHSSDELLLEDGFKNRDFNATSSPNENYELYTQSLPRDATKRSAWNRSTPTSMRTNLRRPSSSLDKRTSPSFENLGKALQESLFSPLKNLGLSNDSNETDDSSTYKRETPRNKRDTRRNTIEGLPNTMTVATSTLTLPHRRPKSKDTVKWTPSSFKSNSLNQRLSRSSQDLRSSIFGSREDLTSPGKLTKSPSMETLQRSKSPKPFCGTSVSNRFRRFESMDALELLETGTAEGQKLDLGESGPDFVQCEFFV